MTIKTETMEKMLRLVNKMDRKQIDVLAEAMRQRAKTISQERANMMVFRIEVDSRVKLVHTMKRRYLRGVPGTVKKVTTGRYPLIVELDRAVGPRSLKTINVGYEAVELLEDQ